MNQTKALTEGAIMASVYAILLLITLFIPILSLVSMFALSLPFTLYTVRHGLKKSFLLVGVALVLTVILGSPTAILMPILFGSVGVVLGVLYNKKKSSFALLLGATLTYLLNLILVYIITILFLEIDFIAQVQKQIKETISLTKDIGGFVGGDVDQGIEQLNQYVEMIPYLIPTALVLSAVVLAFLSIFVSNLVLKRFNVKVPKWGPFRDWSFPKSVIWYYLATIILMYTSPEQGTTLYIVTINLYKLVGIILVLQGLSFIHYYFWVKKQSKAIPVVITIFVFLTPIGFSIVQILGIIDLGFDLRKRIKA
ncbi:YybS family protein [Pseudalkalibacillus decolorationis]|uniref:YybS family protein n=1 Tax=Pseudalkalibacillus decolorationis TaxID=163879 RepID=UPI00214746C8|nr:YybS family protein [Pseudalkalibacillus decolorationis]